eukprot:9484254-Pyramimonas_sp.AAC.1
MQNLRARRPVQPASRVAVIEEAGLNDRNFAQMRTGLPSYGARVEAAAGSPEHLRTTAGQSDRTVTQ